MTSDHVHVCSVQEFISKCKARDPKSIGGGLPITVGDSQEHCQSPEELEKRCYELEGSDVGEWDLPPTG